MTTIVTTTTTNSYDAYEEPSFWLWFWIIIFVFIVFLAIVGSFSRPNQYGATHHTSYGFIPIFGYGGGRTHTTTTTTVVNTNNTPSKTRSVRPASRRRR
jgi:hypothetical protein